MSQQLEMAKRAARAAGRVLLAKMSASRQVHSKGKHDIVTDADYAADRILRDMLLARFPRDRFLSEEGDAAERERLWAQADADPDLGLWVIDPLDGTNNYSRRLHPYCVSVALYRAGAVQIGAVHDPIRDELFWAERGQGAFCNGKPIAVSPVKTLDDAVIAVEWARAQAVRKQTTAVLARLAQRVLTVRALGSAALSFCNIAAGRLDLYIHLSLSPWDVAAAALILEEAGGKVTSPDGAAWSVHSQAYVGTNGLLHKPVLRYFKR